jgi:uncharacterized membrane protein YjdF
MIDIIFCSETAMLIVGTVFSVLFTVLIIIFIKRPDSYRMKMRILLELIFIILAVLLFVNESKKYSNSHMFYFLSELVAIIIGSLELFFRWPEKNINFVQSIISGSIRQ